MSLLIAMMDDAWQTVFQLLHQGANPNEFGERYTPLTYTCHKGKYDVIITLLQKGAHPTLEDSESFTPLMRAAHAGHLVIVQRFVEMFERKYKKHKEIPALLETQFTKAFGMALSPDLETKEYKNPQMFDIAKYLIEHGANPNKKCIMIF